MLYMTANTTVYTTSYDTMVYTYHNTYYNMYYSTTVVKCNIAVTYCMQVILFHRNKTLQICKNDFSLTSLSMMTAAFCRNV